jgi:outer membrane protein TolC
MADCAELNYDAPGRNTRRVAQVQALAAQTAEVQVRIRQMQAAVSLIRALGGGWTEQALPNEKQTLKNIGSDPPP